MADHVLYMGVRGVTDLMMAPGLVNLDFADIRTVMAEMGKAMMGTGEAEGENRAIRAAEAAISNPLLEDTSMAGARGLLINITGGDDMTLFEVDQAANRIREEVDEDANIIFGSAIDDTLQGKIRVSVVATGIDGPATAAQRPRLVAVGGGAAHAATPIPIPAGVGIDSHGYACAGKRNGGRAAPRSRAGDAACPPRAGAGSGPWSRATCRCNPRSRRAIRADAADHGHSNRRASFGCSGSALGSLPTGRSRRPEQYVAAAAQGASTVLLNILM